MIKKAFLNQHTRGNLVQPHDTQAKEKLQRMTGSATAAKTANKKTGHQKGEVIRRKELSIIDNPSPKAYFATFLLLLEGKRKNINTECVLDENTNKYIDNYFLKS